MVIILQCKALGVGLKSVYCYVKSVTINATFPSVFDLPDMPPLVITPVKWILITHGKTGTCTPY